MSNKLRLGNGLCVEEPCSIHQEGLHVFIDNDWGEVYLNKYRIEILRDHLNKVLEQFDEKGVDNG